MIPIIVFFTAHPAAEPTPHLRGSISIVVIAVERIEIAPILVYWTAAASTPFKS
jgi:hypothetical protein